MTPGPTEHDMRLAKLAYSMGYSPVMLEYRGRARWDMADLVDPLRNETIGPSTSHVGWEPEAGEKFPAELWRYEKEIRQSCEGLSVVLPERIRERMMCDLDLALTRAFAGVEEAWMSQGHREMVHARDLGEEFDPGMIQHSSFSQDAWNAMHEAVGRFCEALPEPLATTAMVGAHIAAQKRFRPPGAQQIPPLPQNAGSPAAVLEYLIPELVSHHPSLGPLEADFSQKHFEATSPHGFYWLWLLEELERLHWQIMTRFSELGAATQDEKQLWVSASQAAQEAQQRYGLKLGMSEISKLAKLLDPPFKSRQPVSPKTGKTQANRRRVELGGFLAYAWRRSNRLAGETSDDSSEKEQAEITKKTAEFRAQKQRDRGES